MSVAKRLSCAGDEDQDKSPSAAGGSEAKDQLSAYSKEHGYFLRVEGLLGSDPSYHYRVVVEPPAPGLPFLVGAADSHSDAGSPRFKETPVVVTGTPACDLSNVLFHLLVYMPETGEVRRIGWTVTRLFTSGCSRKGRFHVPMFEGTPPPALLKQAESDPLRVVIKAWLVDRRRSSLNAATLAKINAVNKFVALGKSSSATPATSLAGIFSKASGTAAATAVIDDDEEDSRNTIDYMKPRCVVTIAQGSPEDMNEMCFLSSLPAPNVVLVVPKRQAEFPLRPGQGDCGTLVQDVAAKEDADVAMEQFFKEKWLSKFSVYGQTDEVVMVDG